MSALADTKLRQAEVRATPQGSHEGARERPLPAPQALELSALQRRLLNDFQHDFPLEARPFAAIASRLGVSEEDVIRNLQALEAQGLVSRVGPVFSPGTVGVSTLAAMAVPAERLEEVARLVSAYPEVNHNYEREHAYNLWFVLTAADATRLGEVLEEIGRRSGLEVMDLPLERPYHIDLGFSLW